MQVANADFFLKTLPLFDAGDDVGMVLSPQSFYNVDTNQDIFNHGNIQFWEYAQHGYDAIGFISCTGALPQHPAGLQHQTCGKIGSHSSLVLQHVDKTDIMASKRLIVSRQC